MARQLRNTSTKAEIILWQKLKRKQMHGYDFDRQKPADNYILDFVCYDLMLGIEVDGYSHELNEVYNKDIVKEAKMGQMGIHVLRFSDHQVLKDTENVIRAIEGYILYFEQHTPNPSQEGNTQLHKQGVSTAVVAAPLLRGVGGVSKDEKLLRLMINLILLPFLLITFGCSKVDKSTANEISTIKDTVINTSRMAVDSSQLVLVKYNDASGIYYDKQKYQNFNEWFNKLNVNYVYDPDVARELYSHNISANTYAEYVTPGPEFYYLYAYLLQKRNGINDHSVLREKLLNIFGRINAINSNLHFDESYIYFKLQRTAIAAYTEYSVYNIIRPGAHIKNYNIIKQKSLFRQALRQKVFDELQELGEISYGYYARLNSEEKLKHQEDILKVIDELNDLIESPYDLKVSQKFHYKYY